MWSELKFLDEENERLGAVIKENKYLVCYCQPVAINDNATSVSTPSITINVHEGEKEVYRIILKECWNSFLGNLILAVADNKEDILVKWEVLEGLMLHCKENCITAHDQIIDFLKIKVMAFYTEEQYKQSESSSKQHSEQQSSSPENTTQSLHHSAKEKHLPLLSVPLATIGKARKRLSEGRRRICSLSLSGEDLKSGSSSSSSTVQPNTARDQAVAGIDWIFSVPSLSGSSSSVPSGNATNSYLSSVSSAVARSNLSGSQAVGQTADVTRTEDIFALFALPRETVIMVHGVSLWLKEAVVPLSATCSVTHNYLIFVMSEYMQERKRALIFLFTDIIAIERHWSGSIRLMLKQNKEFSISSLWGLDEFSSVINHMWSRAIENLSKQTDFAKREIDCGGLGVPSKMDLKHFQDIRKSVETVQTKEDINTIQRNDHFTSIFNLPSTEILVQEFPLSDMQFYVPDSHAGEARKLVGECSGGSVYLTHHLLCVCGNSNFSAKFTGDVTFVIPFSLISSINKGESMFLNSDTNTSNNKIVYKPNEPENPLKTRLQQMGKKIVPLVVNIITTSGTKLVLSLKNRSTFFLVLQANLDSFKKLTERDLVLMRSDSVTGGFANRFSKHVLADSAQFTSTFHHEQGQLDKLYVVYFATFSSASHDSVSPLLGSCRTGYFNDLIISRGAPFSMKGAMWVYTANSYAYSLSLGKNYYTDLWKKQEAIWLDFKVTEARLEASGQVNTDYPENIVAMRQIEKDLHRSLMHQPFYKSKHGGEAQGIKSLRRLLQAFALRNPAIGYCQSMNIIAATLLLFLEEEDAFYLFVSIIEKIPEYYEKSLLGAIVDIRVFGDLLEENLPDLAKHLKDIHADLTLVVLPWFMTLYIGYVPWEISLRVLDCLFANGPDILLQVGLAILKIHEIEILAEDNIVSVLDCIRNSKRLNVESLIEFTFVLFATDSRKIAQLRRKNKYQTLLETSERNKEKMFAELSQSTTFTTNELVFLYSEWKDVIKLDSRSNCVDMIQFGEELIMVHLPWLSMATFTQMEILKLYKYFNKKDDMLLSFIEYVKGLHIFLKGTKEELQLMVFNIYCDSDGERMGGEYFEDAATLLLTITFFASTTDLLSPMEYPEDINMKAVACCDEPTMSRIWADAGKVVLLPQSRPFGAKAGDLTQPAPHHKDGKESKKTNALQPCATSFLNSASWSSNSKIGLHSPRHPAIKRLTYPQFVLACDLLEKEKTALNSSK